MPLQPIIIKLLISIGVLLIIPHIGELPLPSIVIGFSLLAWRALTLWFPNTLPSKWLLLPISIGLAFFVLKTFGMSLGRDASSSLLIILMGLKLLESRSSRDIQAVIYLNFFILITPFLFEQYIEIAAYAFCVFFLLLFSLTVNNTQCHRLKNPALLHISAGILILAVPLMLIFFIFFPRMIGPLWAMPNQQSAISGLSDTINPGNISNLALSDKTAFRVRFDGTAPKQKDLYWRGPVFWETDGRSWTLTPPTADLFKRAKPINNEGLDVQYTLMMEPHHQYWLFALDIPAAAPKNTQLTHDHQLILNKKLSRNISFNIRSTSQKIQAKPSDNDLNRALNIPDNTDPRVFDLANKWLKANTDNQGVIKQALEFYNNDFYYTLKPPSLGQDPVAEFLFDTKRGFCGHFATSFATLMRAAGIPSRLVAGYQGGIYNKVGDFYNIRQADAHVWVEVWLDKAGWVRVDPTAAIAPNRIEHSIDPSSQQANSGINFLITPPEGFQQWAQQLKWAINSLDYYWQNAVLAYGPEKQLNFLSNIGIFDWRGMVKWLAMLSTLALVGSIGAVLLLQKKSHDAVQAAYLALCKSLAKRIGQRQPHETTTDYFNRAIKQYPQKAGDLTTLKTLYLNTRYGKEAEHSFIQQVKNFYL